MDFSIKAKQLFIKHTKYSEHDIKNIENIVSSGYTNLNYKITAKDKKQFLVKLSRNKTWIFCDESIITSKYLKSNILYSDNSGNMIKKWVDGELFSLHDNLGNRINLLFREINKVNKINLKNQIPIFNWATYIDFLAKKRKYIDLYNKILLKYKDDNMVVTHGDLNNKNIIISKKNKKESITFIDFEWSCYNYWWFDPISYLCEEQIDDETILELFVKKMKLNNIKELYEMMYLRWYYCFGWANIDQDKLYGIKPYVKLSKKYVKKLFKIITNYES